MLRSWRALVLALALAACGAATSGTQAQSTQVAGADSSAGSTPELTDTMRLMLGTLKLKDVGLEPDAQEASQLLTLWQGYQSVITSDTAAPAEADAVLKQIRSTMTSEQMDAITAMNLGPADLRSLLDTFRQQASANGGGAGGSFNGFPRRQGLEGSAGPGFAPPDGGRQFEGGGFGAGGGGFGQGGGTPSPQQRATAQARRDSFGNGSRGALFLLRPLIAELKTLAGV
jgi:hypothetical protein